DVSLRIARGGRLVASGQVAPDGSTADARITLSQLALAPAQPYIAPYAAVELRSGEFSTTGRVTYRSRPDRPVGTFTGAADVDRGRAGAVLEVGARRDRPLRPGPGPAGHRRGAARRARRQDRDLQGPEPEPRAAGPAGRSRGGVLEGFRAGAAVPGAIGHRGGG